MRTRTLAAAITLLAPAVLAGQVSLATTPATPVRGALFQLRLAPTGPAPVDRIEGVVADEPLHFTREEGLLWTALAPVPVEGGDSLPLLLVLWEGDRPDTVRTSIAVAPGDYAHERLRVAPAMAEPDSAARARIAREVARAREVSRGAQQTARQWSAPFLRPRPTRITSRFGTAREYNGAVTSRHLGTDFAGAVGTPVRATNRGRVALVADFYLAGKVVYLDHGEGLISAYFHLSKALVRTGDTVERGQVIGSVGQSGRVTGPHLHWVMRYGGVTVDPMSVLALLGEPPGP
ncbi:MAG: M23 family metallopeptidase [Gemmatimonadetes bacterium]|nr:M23 family metallopeptidase [Gemmatimonadota bacterium]MBP6669548.1 M23 family metallopeptidase [Gemmatimonadales bacterium]MBK7714367.1 M23 family metallopeptidase [Gemmatimonadota bacterium]MBK7783431.1 M23 family metallopeptidase [Gemmatimonadota bacterium]MBK7924370.1 M23 family metallopeptidase [Gemmatimonadota bacterium]